MSLENPVKIVIARLKLYVVTILKTFRNKQYKYGDKCCTSDNAESNFKTPDSLKHHYMMVPSKLRLETLAAEILWNGKVTPWNHSKFK